MNTWEMFKKSWFGLVNENNIENHDKDYDSIQEAKRFLLQEWRFLVMMLVTPDTTTRGSLGIEQDTRLSLTLLFTLFLEIG